MPEGKKIRTTPRFQVRKPHQQSRHPHTGMTVTGRVWFEKDGELYMGGGRLMLLERIEEYGSIAAAARSMKLGYRNAWLWVEALNRLSATPLVENISGGAGGRHAEVTPEGHRVMQEYKDLNARFSEFLAQNQ